MTLINLEKAIEYAKEKDYIKTSEQEKAVREVFEFAKVQAVLIEVLDKIKAEIDDATEIHSDGEFYIKNIDVKRIIDKYKSESEGE